MRDTSQEITFFSSYFIGTTIVTAGGFLYGADSLCHLVQMNLKKGFQKCAGLLHQRDFIVSNNNVNDIFNDRLKVGRVTSLKKVYSNVQTFFMNLYEGESSENR